MLSDFFRINLPYGLKRNEQGGWMAFNREYMPLGFRTKENENGGLPVHAYYKGLTDKLILEIVGNDKIGINFDEQGKINRFWLYSDSTNPMNQSSKDNKYWAIYWDKLEKLARLNINYSKYVS